MADYLIEDNTGNIINDTIETIKKHGTTIMIMLFNNYYKGNKIAFWYKEEYDEIPNVSKKEKEELYKKGYIVDFNELLNTIINYNDEKYSELILLTCALLIGKDDIHFLFVALCLKIITNEETFKKFMDFDNNIEYFSFDNFTYSKEEYMSEIMEFLCDGEKIIIEKNNKVICEFKDKNMVERYNKIRNKMPKKKKEEEFVTTEGYAYSLHKQRFVDNDWQINKEIESYVLDGIKPEYTLEEKIAHIYIKLCMLFEYDGPYALDENAKSIYDKDAMEQINIENPAIICNDFAHYFTKLVNRYEDVDARSVRCGKSENVHEYVILQISWKNIKADIDPINLKDDSDDLINVRLGTKLQGIKYIKDEQDILKTAVEKIYRKILSEQKVSTFSLLEEYQIKHQQEVTIDYDANFKTFIDEAKKRNVKGNELLILFCNLKKRGYFGEINYSFVDYKSNDSILERMIIFERNGKLFGLSTMFQEIEETTKEELNALFFKGQLVYEDDKYTIEGVGLSK